MNVLPLIPSEPHYIFRTTLNDTQYSFDVRWNSRDQAWYFDMFDREGVSIVLGAKIVLGTYLGRRSTHDFFATNILVAVDESGQNRDAGFDDLGTRVNVYHLTSTELAGAIYSF